MTHDRDIERILGRWLGDGPTEVPDRVIDVVADRIDHQAQRPAWRLRWTTPNLNVHVRAVAAFAAVVLVAVAGFNLVGGSADPGVGTPPATPSLDPTGSPVPTLAPSFPRSLEAGSQTSANFHPALHFDVPAGWAILDDQDRAFVLIKDTGPGEGAIGLTRNPVIASNDQECAGLAAPGVEATVAGMVRALIEDPRLETTAAQPVTVAGYFGQTLDIQLAPTWVGTCPWSEGERVALVLTVPDPPCCIFGLYGSEKTRVIVLDIGDAVVTIGIDSVDGSNFDQIVARAQPIIETFEFTP